MAGELKKVITVDVYQGKNVVKNYGFMAGDKNTPVMEVNFRDKFGVDSLEGYSLRYTLIDNTGSLLIDEVTIGADNIAVVKLPNELFEASRKIKVQLAIVSADDEQVANINYFVDSEIRRGLAEDDYVEPVYEVFINKINDHANEIVKGNLDVGFTTKTEPIPGSRIPDGDIPARKLKSSTDADRIQPYHLSDAVKAMMTGDTPVSPVIGEKEVTREKLADKAIGLEQIDDAVVNNFSSYNERVVAETDVSSKHITVSVDDSGTLTSHDVVQYQFRIVEVSEANVISFLFGGNKRAIKVGTGEKYISVMLDTTEIFMGTVGTGIDNVSFNNKGLKSEHFVDNVIPAPRVYTDALISAKLQGHILTVTIDGNYWFALDCTKVEGYEEYFGEGLGFVIGGTSTDAGTTVVAKQLRAGFYKGAMECIAEQLEHIEITDSKLENLQQQIGVEIFSTKDVTLLDATESLSYNDNLLKLSRTPAAYKSTVTFSSNELRFEAERSLYYIKISEKSSTEFTVVGLDSVSGGFTRYITDVYESSISVRYNATQSASVTTIHNPNLIYSLGDEIYVENNDDYTLVSIRKQGEEDFEDYFTIHKERLTLCENLGISKIGVTLGLSGNETTGVSDSKNIMSNIKYSKDDFDGSILERIDKLENWIQTENIKKKYAVVLVAGQSNAVGYDESRVNGLFDGRIDNRVFQLGFKGDNNLKIVPLTHCAENFQDMTSFGHPDTNSQHPGTKGLHLPLGKLIAKELPNDYDVLVIPCAYGGTGFNSGNVGSYDSTTMKPSSGKLKWSDSSPYFSAMRDRVKYILDLDAENVFLGVVWIQGENDSENAGSHLTAFNAMTTAFFSYFNENGYGARTKKGTFDKDIWFNCETVAYWYTVGQCQQIWDNYREWNPNTYVEIPRDTDSNEINGTGSTSSNRKSHFGNNAFREVVAPAIFERLKRNM